MADGRLEPHSATQVAARIPNGPRPLVAVISLKTHRSAAVVLYLPARPALASSVLAGQHGVDAAKEGLGLIRVVDLAASAQRDGS